MRTGSRSALVAVLETFQGGSEVGGRWCRAAIFALSLESRHRLRERIDADWASEKVGPRLRLHFSSMAAGHAATLLGPTSACFITSYITTLNPPPLAIAGTRDLNSDAVEPSSYSANDDDRRVGVSRNADETI